MLSPAERIFSIKKFLVPSAARSFILQPQKCSRRESNPGLRRSPLPQENWGFVQNKVPVLERTEGIISTIYTSADTRGRCPWPLDYESLKADEERSLKELRFRKQPNKDT